MSREQHWTAEQTAHPDAKADRWAIVYDPTPGGRDNGDGTRSYSLRFPALLISDLVSDPEATAREIADSLNRAGKLESALKAISAARPAGQLPSTKLGALVEKIERIAMTALEAKESADA